MLRYIGIICAFCTLIVASNNLGPRFPPTKGEVWPKPQQQLTEDTYYTLDLNLKIEVVNYKCDLLTNAIERHSFYTRDLQRIRRRNVDRSLEDEGRDLGANHTRENHYKGHLEKLIIDLTSPCENLPYFGMDESYNLTVATVINLRSASVWGILRGLETWSQLFYIPDDFKDIRINTTDIVDYPRYIHRGLLIDTSRHFISMSNILKTLDAMSMNKMNVLHWHIVDDQSFPYQSEKFPDLSRLGAYHHTMVYSKADIQTVINYAKERGIRVLPEFDVPGHTRSWGVAYPNILTSCYNYNEEFTDLGPMNPIHNGTYKLLKELFVEVQEWFPDKYFHVGGDEVDLACWESNPQLKKYMKEHNMTSADKLHALFMENVIPLLGDRSTPIVWQEVFDELVPLSKDTLIHVWKGSEINEMLRILSSGYKVLFSSAWYLDHLKTGGDWADFYRADPRRDVLRYGGSAHDAHNIVGGEACMWGEVVDDMNIISRVWPRASAVAEKLWSAEVPMQNYYSRTITQNVYSRLEEHTCRMNRRGVHAQPPTGPGFCVGAV